MSSSDNVKAPAELAAELWLDQVFETEQARRIFTEILPGVLERFLVKNADYGDETAAFLGAKGQFADINPKFWKLKKALWEGEPLAGEPIEEILADLIGHCLLTLLFLASEKPKFLNPRESHNHRQTDLCLRGCPAYEHNHNSNDPCPSGCPARSL